MEEHLRKEEILSRSRRENRNGDEREKTVRIQGESFSLIFVFVLGIVLLGGSAPMDCRMKTCCPCSGSPVWLTGSTG